MVCVQMMPAGSFSAFPTANATRFMAVYGGRVNFLETAVTAAYGLVTSPGYFQNIQARITVAMGASNSITFALYVEGAASATLTCTISGAVATRGNSPLGAKVKVKIGDRVCVRITTVIGGAAPGTYYGGQGIDFVGTNAGESIYPSPMGIAIAAGQTALANYATGSAQTSWINPASARRRYIPTNGRIKNFATYLPTAPGVGQSVQFWLYLNNNPTAVTVTFSAASGVLIDQTHTFRVKVGDYISIVYTSSAAAAVSAYEHFGFTFVADIDGESLLMSGTQTALTGGTTTQYNSLTNTVNYSTTEEPNYINVSTRTVIKKLLFVILAPAIVAGTYTVALRNGDTPATLNNSIVTDLVNISWMDTTHVDLIADNTILDIIFVEAAVTSKTAWWSLVCLHKARVPEKVVRTVNGQKRLHMRFATALKIT